MRVRRTPYIIVFLVAGLVAGGVYLFAQPRTEIVRARVDVPVLTQITADMVETIRVSPADAPSGAARSADEVVGTYADGTVRDSEVAGDVAVTVVYAAVSH